MIVKNFRYRERAIREAVRWLRIAGRPDPIPLSGDGGEGAEWRWWRWEYPAAPRHYIHIVLSYHTTGQWTLYVEGAQKGTPSQPQPHIPALE
jgi:hypothetical protein